MAAWRFNGWTTSASWWNRLMPLSLFRRAGPRTRRASHDRRRLVRARHWTARPARRDRHDAYAGRPRPDRTLAISRATCGRRSPERPGERSGLPACHVRRGRPRRYAGPAPRARRAARRRGGSVRKRVSALLRPRPRGHSHRAGRANRLTPDTTAAERVEHDGAVHLALTGRMVRVAEVHPGSVQT